MADTQVLAGIPASVDWFAGAQGVWLPFLFVSLFLAVCVTLLVRRRSASPMAGAAVAADSRQASPAPDDTVNECTETTQSRLALLLTFSPSVIYSFKARDDFAPTFVSGSLSKLFGYEPSEYLENPAFWRDRVHPDDLARVEAEVARLFEEGSAVLEYRFRRKDGNYCWVGDEQHLIRDDLGAPLEVVGSWSDVSARKRAEQEQIRLQMELRQAQKLEALGTLAGGIAHEINTPVQYVGDNVRFLKGAFGDLTSVVDGCVPLVQAGTGMDFLAKQFAKAAAATAAADLEFLLAEIPESIDQALEGINRIAEIVTAIKEFSQPGDKRNAFVDINHAIRMTVTITRNQWSNVAEMDLDQDEGLPCVPCPPSEFNQVMLSLIVNAAQAIEESGTQGRIGIKTHAEGDVVVIAVSDTGCGIAEENLEKIFEPFFTTKEVGRGTGQGLAIVHAIVTKRHGGSIAVESVVGEGTTFTIRLPICEVKDSEAA